MPTQVDAVRAAIGRVVQDRGADLVQAYYDEAGPFAGRLFDELPGNDTNRFTPNDLVAASLLDVRFGPRAVRKLLVDADELNVRLAAVGTDFRLWEQADLRPAAALWGAMRAVPIGRTRTSKLMARKRPHMLPILDSVISKHLCLDGAADRWVLLREALMDEGLRRSIDSMAPQGVKTPSTLRVLDVATWMRYSESKNARKARSALNLPVSER